MVRRIVVILSAVNVALIITTAAFIHLWATLDQRGSLTQSLIRYVLVQFHLATENVLAAWYSSMLLLTVAVLCGAAYVLDRRRGAEPVTFAGGWLVMAGTFLLLSLDEIGSLHERIGMLIRDHATGRPMGWTSALAVPIAAVAVFMLAFAWRHLRRTPRVLRLVIAGVALFVTNPVLERIEMSIIHGEYAAQGTWQRTMHDGLLVFEEGVNELFGTLCFLAAAALHIQARLRGGAASSLAGAPRLTYAVGVTSGVLLGAAALASPAITARLPAADTGLLANWFPAAALFLLAAALVAHRVVGRHPFDGPAAAWLAGSALALSAWFGAGLHGYTTWHRFDALREIVRVAVLVSFVAASAILMMRLGWSWMTLAGVASVVVAVSVTSSYAPALAAAGAALCGTGLAAWQQHPSDGAAPTSSSP